MDESNQLIIAIAPTIASWVKKNRIRKTVIPGLEVNYQLAVAEGSFVSTAEWERAVEDSWTNEPESNDTIAEQLKRLSNGETAIEGIELAEVLESMTDMMMVIERSSQM